jgi:membrane associated rhomboid family serine protease
MFVLVPYQVDVPMERWPVANWVILAAIAAAFVLQLSASGASLEPYVLDGWSPRGLLGHMWLHADLLHLLGNLVFLWAFGNAICAKLGNAAYAALYPALGLVAAATHVFFDGGPAVGASGAINGIVGMYVVMYPLNAVMCFAAVWIYIYVRTWRFAVTGIWLILLWLAFDILGIVLRAGGVAYWAHVGGFAAGAGLGLILEVTGIVKPTEYERSLLQVLRRQGGGRYLSRRQRAMSEALAADREGRPPAATASGDAAPKAARETIRLECTCGQGLKVPGRFVGRMVKCPVCGQAIRVRPP